MIRGVVSEWCDSLCGKIACVVVEIEFSFFIVSPPSLSVILLRRPSR